MTGIDESFPPRPDPPRPARLEPLIELDRLVVAVRLRRRACLIGALSGVALGLAVPHVLGGPAATASVLLSRGDVTGPLYAYVDKAALLQAAGAAAQPRMMPSTGMALCSSGSVAGPAAATLGISPTAMLASYSCSDAAPDVIRITVRGRSPERARQAAAAITDSFLTAYRAQGRASAEVQSADLLAQRGRLEANLAEVTRSLAGSTFPAQIDSLTGLQKDLLTRIDDLTARASDLQTVATTASAGSRVVDPPISVRRPPKLLFPAAGGVLGLGLGVVWAALGAVVRDRPLRRREISEALGEPIALDIVRTRRGFRRPHDVGAATALLARLIRTSGSVLVLESGCPKLARQLTAAAAPLPGPDSPTPPAVVVGPLRPTGTWAAGRTGEQVALLLIAAGHESAAALRVGTDDLRTAGIPIAAVFLVDPDPYDRTDGFATEAFGRIFEPHTGAAT
jgi:hypothetical protein